jgi:glycine C-acetyltransferase/8-amino-7-oxononanoate synthase
LRQNCETLRNGLRALDYKLGDSASQILPLIVGDAGACMKLSGYLLSRGIFAQGIRPPTVPPGTSRLRITLMATHTREHLRRALKTFEEASELHRDARE